MKTLLSILLLSLTTWTFSQDKQAIADIDVIVNGIKESGIPVDRKVTAIENMPGITGLNYQTVMKSEGKLLLYAQDANMDVTQEGTVRRVVSSSLFYFHNNKLAKVEESLEDGELKMEAVWYFKDDKLIFSTLTSENDKKRADMLIQLSKTFVEQITLN